MMMMFTPVIEIKPNTFTWDWNCYAECRHTAY